MVEKQTKTEVEYTSDHGTSNEQCSKCVYFRHPDGCEAVMGTISPGGWCELFKRK